MRVEGPDEAVVEDDQPLALQCTERGNGVLPTEGSGRADGGSAVPGEGPLSLGVLDAGQRVGLSERAGRISQPEVEQPKQIVPHDDASAVQRAGHEGLTSRPVGDPISGPDTQASRELVQRRIGNRNR